MKHRLYYAITVTLFIGFIAGYIVLSDMTLERNCKLKAEQLNVEYRYVESYCFLRIEDSWVRSDLVGVKY